MTLNIELTPQETVWLVAQAQQQGLQPAEIVKRLIDAQVAATPAPPPLPWHSRPQSSAPRARQPLPIWMHGL